VMVQNPPPSIAIPSLVNGFSTVVEEPELQVGAELVGVVIVRVACRDPSPHNALPILLNPIHIIHMVVEDGVNIQPLEGNLLHIDTN
jgi:hypothetical protein